MIKNDIHFLNSIKEVVALVHHARVNRFTIRVLGSQHSPSTAIASTQNQSEIQCVLSGELRAIHDFRLVDDGQAAIVKVGAGCNLGINPQDPSSTLANSFNHQIDRYGFALPTLGGITHQTIAGFLQTGSSGGTYQHSITDVIESIELITGMGEHLVLQKQHDLFNAALVAMGLFGIIVFVTFKLPPRYFVKGMEENKIFRASWLQKDKNGTYSKLKRALFAEHEYAHINWFPQKYLHRVMQWQGHTISDAQLQQMNIGIKPYHHALESKVISLCAAAILKLGNGIDRLNRMLPNNLLHKIKASLLKPFVALNDQQEFCDIWYHALPIDDQADVDGLINTAFSEIWFPKDQLDKVMSTLENLFHDHPHTVGNFIVELYAAKQSPAWLSPAYQCDAIRVDLYWWLRNRGSAHEYFSQFWQCLLPIPGARLHWGKHLPEIDQTLGSVRFNRAFLMRNYPRLHDWLTLRAQIDPQQIFVTDYWRQLFAIESVETIVSVKKQRNFHQLLEQF